MKPDYYWWNAAVDESGTRYVYVLVDVERSKSLTKAQLIPAYPNNHGHFIDPNGERDYPPPSLAERQAELDSRPDLEID